MKGQVSKAVRGELIQAIRERYQLGTRSEKRRILDEFLALTGYHRKHAIRLLTDAHPVREGVYPPRERVYGKAVREALIVLWEASDRVCGKRLKALVPLLINALERHGHLYLDPEVRCRVLAASPATIDRILAPTRAAIGGKLRRRPSTPAIRRNVPVRTFADWKEPKPGFMEADLVAHSGVSMAGSFVHTLVLTDVASGWTECVPLVVRSATLVVEAVARLREVLPFELLGMDVDNGTEFLNECLFTYCNENTIEFTRSRPYHKNDQAWVEQKNGAIVRKIVGYGRIEGLKAAKALMRLYAASRLFVNFFQPSFKLASKTRIGARVTKRYHAPATPCARLMSSESIPDQMKERLKATEVALDPLRLLEEIRTMQEHLAQLVAGEALQVPPHQIADLDQFLNGLSTAWQSGEVRPTHRPPEKPARTWRTREDPFEKDWLTISEWLETEPDRTAKELLQRLQIESPTNYTAGQLRTLQRRVKAWRDAEARRLVFAGNAYVTP
ncbi:ISNCY family transposase [Holophaga foetida]|uniref:ISNCY family transposase n=1 Tax=Holophaga foetida TaxID=35839 RepID=UPI000247213C|nr:ISNCY family transposase [Holophaga foetida]